MAAMVWEPRDASTRRASPEASTPTGAPRANPLPVDPSDPERSEGSPVPDAPPADAAGLWIDTDNALGADRGNVDDGLAIAALLGSRARVIGISCVAGNTDAASVVAATRALLQRIPRASGGRLLAADEAAARPATP